MEDPTVYIVIGPSAITRDSRGELLETVDWNDDNTPDWSGAGICDHRGGGGQEGYEILRSAFDLAELNARMIGETIARIN